MSNHKKFLEEFEKYLKGNSLKFKKYKIDNLFVYDIEKTVVISIEFREDFSKDHIVVREILNLKNEKESNKLDIRTKPFFLKYIKEWITYYSFNGEITDELKLLNKKLPTLSLMDRYEKWEGYKVVFAVLKLEDYDKIGYALVECPSIGGVVELREIGKNLLNSYINFIIKNPLAGVVYAEVIKGVKNYEFIITENMAEILNKRYVNKYPLDSIRLLGEISDLKGFWKIEYLKNKKDIPYKFLEELENGTASGTELASDIYTENMKLEIPDIEDLYKKFYYVSVVYADNLTSRDIYDYISTDETIKEGDIVLVNRRTEDIPAIVVYTEHCFGYDVPYPIKKTKNVIKKIENIEELKEYGYNPKELEEYSYYYQNKEDEEGEDEIVYYYYIVTTLCDKEEIANKISKTLMEKRLVAGSQISKVKSDYWWGGKIETKEEFKLEFRTRSDKVNEIVDVIKSIHDYQVPAISRTEITCLTEDTEKWINESVE